MSLRVGLIQLTTPAQQAEAFTHAIGLINEAALKGAQLIILPEGANLMEARPEQKAQKIVPEAKDVFVQEMAAVARHFSCHILIGSAIVANEDSALSANRSILFDPKGQVIARYDKIHLFDADTPDGQSYRESHSIRPGHRVVMAPTVLGRLGLTICYDLRFPNLFRQLARLGASMITVPAAFTVPTGQAHWEVLLRARAIETGCFILAAAQGGSHEDGRRTFGHSMIVNPWGEIITKAEHNHPCALVADIDLSEVAQARARLPQLLHERHLGGEAG